MITGKVKWFNNQKGYGFIVYEPSKEIFVHFKDVANGLDGIKEGDDVEFETADGKKGLQAVNVRKV